MLFASRYALELRDDGTIRGYGTDSDGDFQVMFGRFDKTSGRMGWLEQGSVYTVCTGTCVWRDGNAGRFVSPEGFLPPLSIRKCNVIALDTGAGCCWPIVVLSSDRIIRLQEHESCR